MFKITTLLSLLMWCSCSEVNPVTSSPTVSLADSSDIYGAVDSSYLLAPITLTDTLVQDGRWLVTWLENDYIKCTFIDDQTIISDSIKFDPISKDPISMGFNNIIHQEQSNIKSSVLYFYNKNTAIMGIPDAAWAYFFFLIKKNKDVITIEELEVDMTRLPGSIVNKKLIITDPAEYKNDTLHARYIYVYQLDTNILVEAEQTILDAKEYEVIAPEGGAFFYQYDNKSIYKFIQEYLHKK